MDDSNLDDGTTYYCNVCGNVDEHYDENADSLHAATPKHICNQILSNYKQNKKSFSKNRDGIAVYCTAVAAAIDNDPEKIIKDFSQHKIRINAKPNQSVRFTFQICNDMSNDDILVVGMQLAHPQPQFVMNVHPYVFGGRPHILARKSSITKPVYVTFETADTGLYEMPIMFTFHRESIKKNIIFIREMVVDVQEHFTDTSPDKTPYRRQDIGIADHFIKSTAHAPYEVNYKIPKPHKKLFPINLEEEALQKLKVSPEEREELRAVLVNTRATLDQGLTENNYIMYFRYLLWWEEVVARINLKKYNMSDVTITWQDGRYWLEVPGLAEKRPSLLRGDRVFMRPGENTKVLFEGIIEDIRESTINIGKIDESFGMYYSSEATFNVRFLMSRVPLERMHDAVSNIFSSGNGSRIFPVAVAKPVAVKRIQRFYNPMIGENPEQRAAVEHIVSKTSGQAPYIVFGPPGTGKTMTVVEAIIQIVVKNPSHRVLVCTDSNMAADHIALQLLAFQKELNINRFLLRANSRNREWSIMPPELIPVSNGSSFINFHTVHNDYAATFRVLVTTLMHSAKYSSDKNKMRVTHLFIDEAAQAKEPAALVPISGLLANTGQLVLAGDPQQLGPVCMSKKASKIGLGESLLERLWKTYQIYDNNPNYITTLVNNFRSHPDILHLPNELFYHENPLQPKAALDPLSNISILGLSGGNSAVVFHSVNSMEQRMGISPSYYNEKELLYLQKYTSALVHNHGVSVKDIGVIAPYIRQVYKMREWLRNNGFGEIEVGTVESFQGKEKRVILVSTVRANCRLLDYDAKYGLGFLVDDKRFNVALTRAKAKLIIVGNPACLTRDAKWRKYMEFSRTCDSYHGQESEQLPRTASLLVEVARTRFDRCRLTEALAAAFARYEEAEANRNRR